MVSVSFWFSYVRLLFFGMGLKKQLIFLGCGLIFLAPESTQMREGFVQLCNDLTLNYRLAGVIWRLNILFKHILLPQVLKLDYGFPRKIQKSIYHEAINISKPNGHNLQIVECKLFVTVPQQTMLCARSTFLIYVKSHNAQQAGWIWRTCFSTNWRNTNKPQITNTANRWDLDLDLVSYMSSSYSFLTYGMRGFQYEVELPYNWMSVMNLGYHAYRTIALYLIIINSICFSVSISCNVFATIYLLGSLKRTY